MPLKLMYITNRPDVAKIAEKSGVDRIFVDMEYIGKAERQGGMDTVQSHHTIEDIKNVRSAITTSELLVRCNPIHDAAEEYCSSKDEIDQVVEAGADIIMLPFFKTVEEVQSFLSFVNGRCKTMLLFETPEAVEKIDEILALDGIDELFIGLNDLSIGYKKGFMFELLADGTVEQICEKFKTTGLPYGFGGIASLGKGMLPSEKIIIEHYRLGSSCVILSRSFCNINHIDNIETVNSIFMEGVHDIREFESQCDRFASYFRKNRAEIADVIKQIQGSNT